MSDDATSMESADESIAAVTAAFYSAFANIGGRAPVDTLYDICLAEAVIANATQKEPAIYNLRKFVEPRRELLESGALTDFREYEVSGQTQVHGRIALRASRYAKAWVEQGRQMRGAGTKMFSFVQTPQGWRIASVLWHDDTSGVAE